MAAPSDALSLINLARIQIREKPLTLTGLSDTDDPGAIVANLAYDQVRQELLRNHTWNCARARTTITLSATEPAFDYAGCYELGDDVLKVHHVGTEYDQWASDVRWRHDIEGRRILYGEPGSTADESIKIEYTTDLTDVTLMDALFKKALRRALAVEFALALTGDAKIVQMAEQLFRQALVEALAINHQERTLRVVERNPIAEARYHDSIDIWDGQLRVPADEWPS